VSYLSNLRVAAFGLACLLATASMHAQGAPAAPGPAGKIGVINIQQAISATAEGKQAAVELETKFASREQELDSLNKQVSDIRQRLSGGASLTDEERQRLNAQGTRLGQRLERKNNEFQEFTELVDRVLSVSHDEILRREKEYQKQPTNRAERVARMRTSPSWCDQVVTVQPSPATNASTPA